MIKTLGFAENCLRFILVEKATMVGFIHSICLVMTFTLMTLTPGLSAPLDPEPTDLTCGQPADVVFLVDSSTSIWEVDFRRYVIPFMKNVSGIFNVGPGPRQTRVGALSFSHVLRKEFDLRNFKSRGAMMSAFDRIHLIGGQTRTDRAIKYATNRMFTSRAGSRSDVPHILIVLTDGKSSHSRRTIAAAKAAQQHGITMFAVGVSEKASDRELDIIANIPAYKFHVSDFSSLNQIMMDLAIRACHVRTETTTPPTTTTTTTTTTPKPTTTTMDPMNDCGGKEADILFVLDSSTSIDRVDFNKRVLGFIRDIIKSLSIGQDKARIGVMTFSDKPDLLIRFTDFSDKRSLLSAVVPNLLSYTTGGTNTAEALRRVREVGFSSAPRPSHVSRLAVVITDGQSWDEAETKAQAQMLKDEGVMVYAIGVGSAVRQEELEAIANSPSEDFVFSVDDFSALYKLKDVLGAKTCAWEVNQMSKTQPTCGDGPIEMTFAYDASSMDNPSKRQVLDNLQMINKRLLSLGGDVKVEVTSGPCPPSLDVAMSRPFEAGQSLRKVRSLIQSRLHSVIKTWHSQRVTHYKTFNPKDGKVKDVEELTDDVTRALVLVMTGENVSELEMIKQEVSWLRQIGVHVFAVLHESVGKYPSDVITGVIGSKRVVTGVRERQDYSGYLTELLCSLSSRSARFKR